MWFKNKDSELEKELVELYVTILISGRGLSRNEAEKTAKDMLEVAKQKMKETDQDKLPQNFGNLILEREKKNLTVWRICEKME